MFCTNCGAALADGARFCNNCGTAVDQVSSTARKINTSKFNKKNLIIILASVLVVVGVIVGTVVGINIANNKPEKVAEKFATAAMSGDPDLLVDCLPDFTIKYMSARYNVPATKKALANAMQSSVSGADRQIVKVLNVVNMGYSTDVYDYEDVVYSAKSMGASEFEIAHIEDYCTVKVSMLVSGENRNLYIMCINFDGKWYAIDLD